MNIDNLEKLPETIEVELFVTLTVGGSYNLGKVGVWDMNVAQYDNEYLLLTTKKVTFNLPQDIDIKGKVIEGLESTKDKINAEFHMKLKEVQDQIDNLLAIEYTPL